MSQSSVTPIRAGTKALPEKVFDVCNQLAEKKGVFRNEDVLALTGGGMATVARLVKTWRQHQHIIEANDTLSAEATITLVEMVDKLVNQQIARSKAAVEDFLKGSAQEITELNQTLDARLTELESTKEDARSLREQLKEREEQLTQTKTRLMDRDQELADTRARVELNDAELNQAQATHAAKLEQLGSQHQLQLGQALEAQRRSMDGVKNDALEKQEHAWRARLEEARKEANKAEADLRDLQMELRASHERAHASELQARDLESELKALKRLYQEQLNSQQALVEEKHQALQEAQNAQRQLTTAIERQLASHTDEFEERLRSLTGAADGVTSALTEIDALLKDFRKAAQVTRQNDSEKGT